MRRAKRRLRECHEFALELSAAPHQFRRDHAGEATATNHPIPAAHAGVLTDHASGAGVAADHGTSCWLPNLACGHT
jgi:hypothetical protein